MQTSILSRSAVLIVLKDVLTYGFNQSAADVLLYPFDEQLSPEKMLKDIGSKQHYNLIVGLQAERAKQLLMASQGLHSSFYNAYLILGLVGALYCACI